MSIGVRLSDASRASFDDSATVADFVKVAQVPTLKVLQCASTVRESLWREINDYFFSARPDVQLRVYGHYETRCDLRFARLMTNVRRFAADCLMEACNIEAITEIPQLESLSVGIFGLEDFRFLDLVPPTLFELSLSATRSKKPNLEPVGRFRELRVLWIEGQGKGIDVISSLHELEQLTLRSITAPDLGFLSTLDKLWSLDIKLGGTRNLDAIAGKRNIKYLELWQVRNFHDLGVMSELPGLQNVFLQSLPHIECLPSLRNSVALRRVVFENLKDFKDFSTLESAPALEEFALLAGNKQTPQQLLPVLRNPNVKRVAGYFGSDRKNDEFRRLCDEYGKEEFAAQEPFAYR